jgi:rod shape-determining protein MreD
VRVNTRTGPASAPITAPDWWVAALYLLGALLVQIELMHYVSVRGAEPSLVLIVLVWYALRADLLQAAVFGFIAGLCEDAFTALPSGMGAGWLAVLPFTALFVSWLSRWFFADSIPAMSAVVVVATLFSRMLFWVMMAVQGYPTGYARLHFHQALWEALLNGILVAVLMLAARIREARA